MSGFLRGKFKWVLAMLLAAAGMAHAAGFPIASDMDMLRSDFGKPELSRDEALISQNGNSNIATINQHVDIGVFGHYAEINQFGQSNQAFVVQTGSSNQARINQTGSFNLVNATQSGSGNSIDVLQNGLGNAIDLAQTGDANLFAANQIGDNNHIVATQNGVSGTLDQSGNNNSITVMSPAAPNVSISIVGSGLSVTVN